MTEQTHKKSQILLIYLALLVSVLIAYEPMRHDDFIGYDDPYYVTENPHITGGLTAKSIIWAFTKPHYHMYHPLASLSHMLDCELFGLNPFWHHLTSLFFHILNTLLLFWVVKRMTGALWAGAFVAALFALHPLQVESVAWVSERKSVLSGFFSILTMVAYVRYSERPALGRYVPVIVVYVLALMSKPVVVTLPFVLLLLDYWPLRRLRPKSAENAESGKLRYRQFSAKWLVMEKLPLFILSAVLCVMTFVLQRIGGSVSPLAMIPVRYRIANVFLAYLKYIENLIWPHKLAIFYPHPANRIPMVTAVICALAFILVSVACISLGRRRKYLAVGWLWFVAMLLPVIGIVQSGAQAMADRYTYIPSIGIFIIVAYAAAEVAARRRVPKIWFAIPAAAALLALLVCTRIQLRYWTDSYALYNHALAVTSNNAVMHNNLGCLLLDQRRFDEAAAHFRQSLKISSDWTASDNLAKTLLKQGRWNEAVKHLNDVLLIRTDLPEVYANLGWAYSVLGDDKLAVANLTKCIELDPRSTKSLDSLAWILATTRHNDLRNPADAVQYAARACQLQPDDPGLLDTLAAAYAAAGNFPEAIKTAQRAIELAQAANKTGLAGEIRSRLELYKAGKPFLRN